MNHLISLRVSSTNALFATFVMEMIQANPTLFAAVKKEELSMTRSRFMTWVGFNLVSKTMRVCKTIDHQSAKALKLFCILRGF